MPLDKPFAFPWSLHFEPRKQEKTASPNGLLSELMLIKCEARKRCQTTKHLELEGWPSGQEHVLLL